jgi:hypothetical protein
MNGNGSNPALKNVAVIGAGPAGLFAARTLADAGVHVVLLNRDVKPGGLAEYGIYHDKETMKAGLRKQFRKIMEEPLISYFGNITIGRTPTSASTTWPPAASMPSWSPSAPRARNGSGCPAKTCRASTTPRTWSITTIFSHLSAKAITASAGEWP